MKNFSLAWKTGMGSVQKPYMARRPGLGQGDFMSSNLLNVITDFSAATLSAYVAYGLGRAKEGSSPSPWAPLFWVFSAMSGVKMLHDIGKPS